MARTTQPSTADLKREFDSLKADLGSLASELRAYAASHERSLTQRAAEGAHATADAVRENANHLRDAVLEKGDQQLQSLRAFAENAAGNAEDIVRDHPASTVAGAAAIGFLIGALAARR